jgi:hypothetical protein
MPLRELFSVKALSSAIGTLAALAGVVSVSMSVYSTVENYRSAVLVRIEKDLNTIPEALAKGADQALYSNPDFGALRVVIKNPTHQNLESTNLEISNLKSFQGVSLVDNCLDQDTRLQFKQKWNQTTLTPPSSPDQKDWTALVLPLPTIGTGAYLKLSVYGLNVPKGDANLKGAENVRVRKQYMIRVADSWRLRPSYEYLVVGVSIGLLVTAAALLVEARKARTAP